MSSIKFLLHYCPTSTLPQARYQEGSISLRQQHRLFETLKIHRFSQLITTFIVTLSNTEPVCAKPIRCQDICGCDQYDEKFGEAISSMTNLQVLEFSCKLCPINCAGPGTHRHEYFSGRMQTRVLQHFSFHCRCISTLSSPMDHVPTSMLDSPMMDTVTSLGLACSAQWFFNGENGIKDSLHEVNTAPLLRIFACDRGEGAESFLAMRPITCLRVVYPNNLHEHMSRSGCKLETLLTNDVLGWLPLAIADNPDLYANLRFIGTIKLRTFKIPNVLRLLDPVTSLVWLGTLEISRLEEPSEENPSEMKTPSQSTDPSEELMRRMAAKHQALRRVFIQGPHGSFAKHLPWKPTVWEKVNGGHWVSREMPPIERNKLLNGALDDA